MTKRDRPETPTDRRRAERAAKEAEYSAEQAAHDKLYVDALDNEAGRKLRTHWLNTVINRRTPPDISDGALRGLEAVRNFVRDSEAAIARYRERAHRNDG